MTPESSEPNRRPLVAGIIAIAVLVLVIGGIAWASKGDEPADTTETTSQTSANESDASENTEGDTSASDPNSEATYKDGSYEGAGDYTSPGGTEEVAVSVNLADGVITDVTVTTDPASPTSQQYQGEFKSGYKALVVGKNIDEVELSKVSGSSLTSQGFNEAIEQIKQQAQSA